MAGSIDISNYLGRWTLILGEVNTGKTSLCRDVLLQMLQRGLAGRIEIIDLAPEIPETMMINRKMKGIGGKLLPPEKENVIYLSAPLVPPRLTSKTEEEAIEKAQQNALKIMNLLEEYNRFARNILFVNDISLSLQAETAERVVKLMRKAETVVANGYYGKKLGGSILSQRERQEMELLKKYFHQIISTQKSP